MEVTYKDTYKIRAWMDGSNVLNFDAQTLGGNTLAAGFDMCGAMSRAEAIKKMQEAVDELYHKGKEKKGKLG